MIRENEILTSRVSSWLMIPVGEGDNTLGRRSQILAKKKGGDILFNIRRLIINIIEILMWVIRIVYRDYSEFAKKSKCP